MEEEHKEQEKNTESASKPKRNFKKSYEKNYKLLLILPAVLLIFSVIYLGVFYSQNNDFFHKDISLTGGTSVTVYAKLDPAQLEMDLNPELGEINVQKISDRFTGEQQGVIIETTADKDTAESVLEDYLGYDLNEDNSSFEFTSSALGGSFYKQLIIAILIAFSFMSLVVFIIFRTPVPSAAVIISALADIIMTLVVVDIIGIKLSTAGIIAFLMLIGYSVDTDILLTTRILKRDGGTTNSRLFGAFKTGITMTLTSLSAIVFALIIVSSFSAVLTQIFTVLSIGLGFDLFNTWVTNASIIKWYAEKK
jgi:preprotein translocase subunit SecF